LRPTLDRLQSATVGHFLSFGAVDDLDAPGDPSRTAAWIDSSRRFQYDAHLRLS
jgi:hypothetical protein